MATDPQARMLTVRYPRGSVRSAKANLDKLLGNTDTAVDNQVWGNDPGPRRPYGYRRRSNSAAGTPVRVRFGDGEEWTYRVTGPLKNFVNRVVRTSPGARVVAITTPRGAEFGREASLQLD